jgi:hypothetical protein
MLESLANNELQRILREAVVAEFDVVVWRDESKSRDSIASHQSEI